MAVEDRSVAPKVGIIMGSKSDWATMQNSVEYLDRLGISHEANIISAHRNPDRLGEYVKGARGRGIKILICGAGMAAALPGVVAAMTPLPVLGVPLDGSSLKGLDSLLAIVQMPAGVPVGTLAIGSAGARNAAILAASILALEDEEIARTLDAFRAEQAATVHEIPSD